MEVDIIRDGTTVSTTVIDLVKQVEVRNTSRSHVVNRTSDAAVDVAVPTYLSNVVVSPTPPAFPYEGQVWIDIS